MVDWLLHACRARDIEQIMLVSADVERVGVEVLHSRFEKTCSVYKPSEYYRFVYDGKRDNNLSSPVLHQFVFTPVIEVVLIIMRLISNDNAEICVVLEAIRRRTLMVFLFGFAILWWNTYVLGRRMIPSRFSLLDKIPRQIRSLHDLVDVSDNDCNDALRMDRVAFARLCDLLQTTGGLRNSKYVCVQEKVAMFLIILAHHTKNKSVKFQFKRSGHIVSKYFHSVMQCVCKLHSLFLIEPDPVAEDNTDPRW
ncbi:hypothetical protein ACS0TY_033664 [Phlomoides rotata]